jgi:hypothetical protein
LKLEFVELTQSLALLRTRRTWASSFQGRGAGELFLFGADATDPCIGIKGKAPKTFQRPF